MNKDLEAVMRDVIAHLEREAITVHEMTGVPVSLTSAGALLARLKAQTEPPE